MIRTTFMVFLAALLPLGLIAKKPRSAAKDPLLADAPAKVQSLVNPYAGNPEAIQAGKKLFARNCASCHGAEAKGHEDAPSLFSPQVQTATPGAKFWFLLHRWWRRSR